MRVCDILILWYSDLPWYHIHGMLLSVWKWGLLSVLMCESLHSNCLYIWALWGCWYVETLTRLLGNDRTGTWQIFMSRGCARPSTHQNIQNPTGLVILGRGINIRLVKIMWEASRWLQLYIKQKFQRISHPRNMWRLSQGREYFPTNNIGALWLDDNPIFSNYSRWVLL